MTYDKSLTVRCITAVVIGVAIGVAMNNYSTLQMLEVVAVAGTVHAAVWEVIDNDCR